MHKRSYLLVWMLVIQATTMFAGFMNGSYVYKGQLRKYSIYVPDIYVTKNVKVPLLLGLHGYGDDIENFKNICMSGIADTANYICVYAEGLPFLGANAWNSGAGSGAINVNSNIDDAGFLNGLIDTVIAKYKIDTTRMYVFGFSFGGFMTDRMAAQHSDRFSAVANVSGLRGNFLTALPAKGMPYLKFHGTADPTISYDGTKTIGFLPGFGLSAENTVKFWVTQNQCNATAVIDTMPNIANDGFRFVRYTYNNGRNNSKVVFYKVINGEHRWYGLPANDISYCQTIWDFFRQYSRQSTVTSVRNTEDKVTFSIYPNPSNGIATIDLSKVRGTVSALNVYDALGRLSISVPVKYEQQVTLSTALPSGIYVVQVIGENGIIASEKIMIQ